MASLLSLNISVLSILLMARHRQGELTDAHWLERFEQEVLNAGQWGAHGLPFRNAREFEGLASILHAPTRRGLLVFPKLVGDG